MIKNPTVAFNVVEHSEAQGKDYARTVCFHHAVQRAMLGERIITPVIVAKFTCEDCEEGR